ncbi:type II secretion system protein [Limosilactobacillus fastidiosus]|uniref:Type II secretion system protein n=1 Tax=Limosilactobacillus fastidiosus TaxID=2759855 RepID=A0A7W3TYM0_9LACO|nr:type II secretion system protein [Limosilactobacillus fastidiosus]MBB1062633.1 type II secretion system protein [Limosilactobacillus fastidiosus]MBB1085445.1 type II secretion system protein [Limosilactobacillus fastidiosus]MCD7083801.1 type II secretion system GspH family protein [Limosilactobacillus fastidiosus]MCD7085347.1 type II secretion system GspH family protein [Limosilactobacillus fastidiosus]MCD7114079.1 type II secretion system GspH family protein [Limosilactobacillus fastidiosu
MKRCGFTILETIIVLVLTALIVTFSFPSLSRSRQVVAEHEFWNDFRQEWQAAQVRSKTRHIETAVTFDSSSYQIEFAWLEHYQPVKKRLTVPETLLVRKFDDFEMHENGYTKPRTQEFQSSINGTTYLMRIQLAWGGYRIETR